MDHSVGFGLARFRAKVRNLRISLDFFYFVGSVKLISLDRVDLFFFIFFLSFFSFICSEDESNIFSDFSSLCLSSCSSYIASTSLDCSDIFSYFFLFLLVMIDLYI